MSKGFLNKKIFMLRVYYIKILKKLKIFKEDEIYYIGGSQVLPPPLNKEEEADLLSRLKADESIKATLIERNIRLVIYIARKFDNTGICIEDLVSIGSIGLIKAVNTFDVDKKIKLATYASKCIENEILMYLRKTSKTKYEISFDEPLNTDADGNELRLSDIMGTDADIIFKYLEEEIDRDLLDEAVETLNDREKQIMELRFGLRGKEERTQKEVADYLNISQSYISRLEKRIVERLEKEISKMF